MFVPKKFVPHRPSASEEQPKELKYIIDKHEPLTEAADDNPENQVNKISSLPSNGNLASTKKKRAAVCIDNTQKEIIFVNKVLTNNRPLIQPTSKRRKVFNVFPSSYGEIKDYYRIVVYLKASEQGIEGIELENVDNRVVISHIGDFFDNQKGLKVKDVVFSVNNIDARYASFDQIINVIYKKPQQDKSSLNQTSRTFSNSVNDSLVCVVFARPK